jgi:hypothetical protein
LYRKDFGPGQGQPLQASDGEPMSYDEKLAQRVRKILAARSDVAEKKMFGGLAFMLRGRMFCGVIKEDLVVRVGPHQHEVALQQPHARPMDFTGRPRRTSWLPKQIGVREMGSAGCGLCVQNARSEVSGREVKKRARVAIGMHAACTVVCCPCPPSALFEAISAAEAERAIESRSRLCSILMTPDSKPTVPWPD